MKYVITLFLALISLSSFSQKGKEYFLIDSINYETLSPDDRAMLDSLLPAYHKAKEDTSKLKVLEMLSEIFNDGTLSIQYTRILYAKTKEKLTGTTLSQTEADIYNRCYAKSLHNLGYYAYTYEEDPKKAIAYYDSCLSMQGKMNDKETISSTYNDIALIYLNQGNISVALDYFLKTLKIDEELGDKANISTSLNNIASVYLQQEDTAKAIQYLEKSIALCSEVKFDRGLAFAMTNLGAIYRDLKNYDKALVYFQNSLPIWEKVGDKQGWGFALQSIGLVYQKQLESLGKPQKIMHDSLFKMSIDYFNKAVKIFEELNSRQGLSHTFSNIGNSYLAENDLPKAIDYGKRALKYAQEIGYPVAIQSSSQLLYKALSRQGKWQDALKMHELYVQMRDSIFNEETQKSTFKQQMKYDYEKQKALNDVENQKEIAIVEEGKKRQQIVSYATGLGLLMVIVFSIFIFNRLQITRKQKLIIEDQKLIVDQKNKHITDSINYAKRIQDSILPSQEELSKYFTGQFIFFRPRDIVSGDFYWYSALPQGEKAILAVADCTGHGVPGAFMSMIGNTLLNEIVNEQGITQPSEILDQLNEGIIQALHQESRSQDDGMDISICLFDKSENKITFAGANHSMYVTQDNTIQEIKGDIYSIGSMFGKKSAVFTQKEIKLQKSSTLFFCTDGFPDQVGGEKGKKFLVRQLEKLLLSVSPLDIKEQEQTIVKTFEDWKGKQGQMDDVLLIGIRI